MLYKAVLFNEDDKAMIIIEDLKHFIQKENDDGSFDYKFTPVNGDPSMITGCFLNLAIFDENVLVDDEDVITSVLDKKIDSSKFIVNDDPVNIINQQQEYISSLEEKNKLLEIEINKLKGLA